MFGLPTRTATVLEHYREVVEEILSNNGIDPQANLEEALEKERYSWCLKRGSATVFIEIFTESSESYFMVDCPILYLPPQNQEAFFRRLLEINDQLVEGTLALRSDEIHLVAVRPLRGLDASEASGVLDRISAWADQLDNQLNEEFGAPLWEIPAAPAPTES
jgi:hypothetical protein